MSTPIGTCLVPEETQGPLNKKNKYRISIKANACRAVWDTDWNLTSDEVRKLREKRARRDRKAGWLHLCWLMIPENLQSAASILAQFIFFCLLVGCLERKRVGQTSRLFLDVSLISRQRLVRKMIVSCCYSAANLRRVGTL